MRFMLAALALVAALAATGPARAAAPAPVPFKPGTVWTYRVLRATPQGSRTVTTRTVTYRGPTTFQGKSYHLFETRESLAKEVERHLTLWTGKYFRVAVAASSDGRSTTETVFDKPYAQTGVDEALAGRAEIYTNGEVTGRSGWSNVVSRGKTLKVTVPAGTFTATRWDGTLILGNLKQIYTLFAVGTVEVRADVDVFNKGVRQATVVVELQSGPVK
ncbi:MAG: hypothetical protein QN141_08605 [Armatimonadota bacterium]|nr:hypothetical protein [Armatimonadota bacterium]MDR7452720.1 hypothetical protein [Armatimonadota bacterium]MDR7467631.1 hypothetical protein [Armatimonadota bacterium]MDR7494408.1 hypothetical protein [Armatimonadota bacterium]MDR7500447.1 hypothetical protein [Armatimonadota bacterium]